MESTLKSCLDEARTRLRERLGPELAPYFDAGQQQVARQHALLREERNELVGVVAEQLESRQAELQQERTELQAERGSLVQSQEKLQAAAEAELKKLDQELAELENQYIECTNKDNQLDGNISVVQLQMQTLAEITLQAGNRRSNLGSPTRFSVEMVALNEKLQFYTQERSENSSQANVIALKAQRLAQSRQALVAEYQQKTGQAATASASLDRWQARVKREVAKLDEPVDRAKAVQQLERKIKDLSTYDRYDVRDEAQRVLARYSPGE